MSQRLRGTSLLLRGSTRDKVISDKVSGDDFTRRRAEINTCSTQRDAKSDTQLSLWKNWRCDVSLTLNYLCVQKGPIQINLPWLWTLAAEMFLAVLHWHSLFQNTSFTCELTDFPKYIMWLMRFKAAPSFIFLVHCPELSAHISCSRLEVCRLQLIETVGELWRFLCTCSSDYLPLVFLVSLGYSYFNLNPHSLNTHSPCPISCHDYFVLTIFDH